MQNFRELQAVWKALNLGPRSVIHVTLFPAVLRGWNTDGWDNS